MTDDNIVFRGNPHHLTMLLDAVKKEDISLWNSYVRKNGSSFKARLAGANLSGLSLPEVRLDGADLTDADLSNTILTRANLSNARLRGCRLTGADLSGARLNHTDFTNADLNKAKMSNVRARGALLTGTNLSEAIMDGADLTNASLKGASVTGLSRVGTRMKVRVKVKTSSDKPEEPYKAYKPWIKALKEEVDRKELRKSREDEKAEEDKARLDVDNGSRAFHVSSRFDVGFHFGSHHQGFFFSHCGLLT